MNIIVIASRNTSKVAELSPILNTIGYDPISVSDWENKQKVSVPEVEETGTTFYANALLKAESVFSDCPFPVLADDSGIVIPALGGEPGVYSARYGEMPESSSSSSSPLATLDQNNLSRDERNIDKVFAKLSALKSSGSLPSTEQTKLGVKAYFCTSIVALIKLPDEEGMLQKHIIHGEGKCYGSIIAEKRGKNGFGYDPIFVPNEQNPENKTFAEMTRQEKNFISHRSLALHDFISKTKKLHEQY